MCQLAQGRVHAHRSHNFPSGAAGLTHGLVSHQRLVVALGIPNGLLRVAPANVMRLTLMLFCGPCGRHAQAAGREGRQLAQPVLNRRPACTPTRAPAHLLHRRPTRVLMLQCSSFTCFSSSIQKSGRPEGGRAGGAQARQV